MTSAMQSSNNILIEDAVRVDAPVDSETTFSCCSQEMVSTKCCQVNTHATGRYKGDWSRESAYYDSSGKLSHIFANSNNTARHNIILGIMARFDVARDVRQLLGRSIVVPTCIQPLFTWNMLAPTKMFYSEQPINSSEHIDE